ncbi:MAG: outer membrane protein assembly factor BamC [Pseudomonadales bacterium]|jgi:outer membrane protein assembly factor BamC
MRIPAAWLTVLVLLGGCGWFNDDKGIFVNRDDDYLDLQERAPLVVPTDLDSDRVADPYPIPRTPRQLNPEFYPGRPPRPDAIFANDNRDEVRIQRLSDRAWLVVPEPTTTVWPKVKQFLAENGVSVASEMSAYGRLDTEWLDTSRDSYRDIIRTVIHQAKAEEGFLQGEDRLLIRVEPGLRENTSEVYVRYENNALGMPSTGVVDLNTIQSAIPAAEIDVLSEIGAYIAARVSEQTVSMVATENTGQVKSTVERDEQGKPVLELRLDYDRAWATVGQALSRAEVEVDNSDEVEGIYYVHVPKSALTGQEKGWFGKLFGGNKGYDLQLHLEPAGEAVYHVTVTDADAKPVSRDFGQEVLIMIREFAS